jgi:cell division protein WhiA
MSLSEDVRGELATIAPARRCDRLAEISALFHTAGSIHLLGRGRVALQLDLGSSAAARRAFALLRELGIHSLIRTYRQHAFDRPTRFQLQVDGEDASLATLAEAGVVDGSLRPLERPPQRVVDRSCCRRAYMRGAFLGAGSLSGPRWPHLELRTPARAGAAFLREIAGREGIQLGVSERHRHAAAYAKGWEAIEALLAAAGASDVVLALEERSVVAATRAQANRLANADHANLVRTSRAAREQLEAAQLLRRRGGLEQLPRRLREAAELRLRHPTLPLAELARRADPPATKAGMQRRLARVIEHSRR